VVALNGKELLEKICRARGEDLSGFVRRAVRKEFAILCEEKQCTSKLMIDCYISVSVPEESNIEPKIGQNHTFYEKD